MAKKWVIVRVEKHVYDGLRSLGMLWVQDEGGETAARLLEGATPSISLSKVVGELLRREQSHRERSKRAGKKK